jgi:hypothetical protein
LPWLSATRGQRPRRGQNASFDASKFPPAIDNRGVRVVHERSETRQFQHVSLDL